MKKLPILLSFGVGVFVSAWAISPEKEGKLKPADTSAKGENLIPADAKSVSLALRLQRTTIEDAYISVPLTDDLFEKKEDNSRGLNFDAFVAKGIELGNLPGVEWKAESSVSKMHGIQMAPPEARKSYNPAVEAEKEEDAKKVK